MSLLQSLDRQPAFHWCVKLLRVRQVAGFVLRQFPRVHVRPGSGVRYRCRYMETVLLADEIFNRNVYLKAIDAAKVTTFADLGCNVGLFGVLLADLTKRKDLTGLMIDANPEMVEEARWHVAENKLARVTLLSGLVGADSVADKVDFYILPSNLGSSQFAVYEPGKPPTGEWKKVQVPRVDMETAWLNNCGDVRCQVLKIDIEGSEKDFLRTDKPFLKRVDTIILEWHKWIVSLETITQLLTEQGFALVEVLEDVDQTGIAWFRQKTN